MRLPNLFIALFVMSLVYTLAAGWNVGFPLILSLWAMGAAALTGSGLVVGGALWGVGRLAALGGRPAPGAADFARYACVGAGVALGLLLIRIHAGSVVAALY